MADFRRWIIVLAVVALFSVGMASAQVGTGTGSNNIPITCGVQNVTVTPNLRSEGYTEATGDIVIVCSGGSPLPVGSQIPTVNVVVFYNATVTSRLLKSDGTSEALLLIDEPNNGRVGSQSGYGPQVNQIPCNDSQNGAGPNGCIEFVGTAQNVGGVPYTVGVPVAGTATSGTPGANVFQGIVNSQSVTFHGIPVLPPVTSGLSRVFRITNVRVNANGVGGGVAGGPGQVLASISISGATSLPLSNPNPIVGYITQGLTTKVNKGGVFPQCNAASGLSGVLAFSENFGTAFKTRLDGVKTGPGYLINAFGDGSNVVYPGTSDNQNIPGTAYNSESNFIVPTINNGTYTAGLADFGTRLKAVFKNVPSGVSVWVSTTNVKSDASVAIGAPSPTNTTATSYAVLLSTETGTDAGGLPLATATKSFAIDGGSSFPYAQMTSTGTDMTAVWEVINTQPQANESIYFSVWVSYSGVTKSFPPAPTVASVNLSYAPTPPAFSTSSAGSASSTNPLPRFADTSSSSTFLTINLCKTTLLFPYVTTLTGFTTGIEIANTTTDPFKTTQQEGTCTLYFYQGANNPSSVVTPVIPTGTIWTGDMSLPSFASANFNGYMIADCNFQLAHGAAVIQDIGAQRIMTTYLALVLPYPASARDIPANGTSESLGN